VKVSSVPSLLLAAQVLPGAGATVTLGVLGCQHADEVSLIISYTLNGGSVIGAPTLRVRWGFLTPLWNPIANPAEGVILQAGTLVVEDLPFATPGAVGAWSRVLPLIVPAGANFLQATLRETGDLANPGTVAVIGCTSVS
jgi:hypothetical protein